MTLPGPMDEVLALTKAGRLADATALVKRALLGGQGGAAEPAHGPSAGPIDLKAPRLPFNGAKPEDVGAQVHERAGASGSFTQQVYQGSEGRIAYRLFVPQGLAGPVPLVIMLHGCTQSAEDFARGTQMNEVAGELGFIVAYPEQTNAANAQKCWNWFRPGDQERGRGEPALIAALTRQIVSTHPIDRERVYVAGLSAGGAAASIMAHAYPDIYAAVGIHSGLACGSAKDVPSAFAAMNGTGMRQNVRPSDAYVPTITFHGDRDRTVHPSNSEAILATGVANAKLASFERRTVEGKSPGGRAFRRTIMVDGGGRNWIEHWEIAGSGHAWSGGNSTGSYTDPAGPDASHAMMEFFLQHRLAAK